MNETLRIIKSRRSIRCYAAEQIKEAELQAILEAGFFAPSANNKQPWHFTVVQNKDLIDRLNEAFIALAKSADNEYLQKKGNQSGYHVFHHAPTVIFLSGDEKNPNAAVDCAAAVQNMLIQAESLNIGTCWIGLIMHLLNSEQGKGFIGELALPSGFKPMHSITIGYKSTEPSAAPERRENIINFIR